MKLTRILGLLAATLSTGLLSGCVVDGPRHRPYYAPAAVPITYRIDGTWIYYDGGTRWANEVIVVPGGINVRRPDRPTPRFYEHAGGNRYRHREGDTYEIRNENELIWRRRSGREVPLKRR